MKVMTIDVPAPGHPLVPVLSVLAGGGDEVVVATGADVRAVIERAGPTSTSPARGLG